MKVTFAYWFLAVNAGVLLAQPGLVPQASVGRAYGTRDPLACTSKKEPARGAPSAEQARQYFICGKSGDRESRDTLFLVENVRAEVGKGRPFQGGNLADINMHDIDPSLPVYPIRGAYVLYSCRKLNQRLYGQRAEDQCMIWDHPNAEGACYTTTFGDWNCKMADSTRGTKARVKPGTNSPGWFPGPR
jgi:hypothetical protein